MPSATVCTITGFVNTPQGQPLAGATVKALLTRPFLHPVSLALIPNYEIDVISDNTGMWSLNLVETTTANIAVTLAFYYPLGPSSGNGRYEYTITVPNSTTANFSDLITGQV